MKSLDQLIAGYSGKQGEGLAFLMEEDPSPTRERLRAAVATKLPKARWCVYEPLGDGERGRGGEHRFGPGVKLRPLLDKADVVLALDSDFLGSAEGTIEGIKGFTKKRRIDEPGRKMNRLYAVENRYTITGGMADHRLRIPASQVGVFARATGGGDCKGDGRRDADECFAGARKPRRRRISRQAGWKSLRRISWRIADGRWCWRVRNSRSRSICWWQRSTRRWGRFGNTLTGIATVSKPAAKIEELAKDIADKEGYDAFHPGRKSGL